MSWASATPPGTQPGYTSYAHAATAYTPVPVRQGFGQPYTLQPQYAAYATPTNPPPAPAAAPAEPQQQQKIDWPDKVRSYVQRSFEPKNMLPDVSREEMEAKLKETISHAKDAGIMYTTEWDNMPLPQMLVRTHRAAQLEAQRAAQMMTSAWSNPAMATAPTEPARANTNHHNSKKRNKSLKQAEKAENRKQRFNNAEYKTYRSPSPPPSTGPILGTCTNLEKSYLRLTAAPKPSLVRPEHILHQTLDLLKKKWRKENNYNYICDQFKSLRQDLTVQRIKNEFTVSVYEIHARIALEKGDLGEYNQCQTQLRALYASGIKGNAVEFKAYRILYFIHTANRTALNDAIADLTTADKEERAIKHALEVRSALALGNYHRFFQLYLDVPNMGAYLMDMFVKRERLAALANMCKAYKPDFKLRFITEELAFESDAEAAQFIIDHNGQHLLVEREDSIIFMAGNAKQLFETARADAHRRVDLKGQI
ncbi:SAC3/GANP/Nin1/mts3/eIF-3 p25 family-domain-containing protein [Apiospora kogelbergensis]|uniref:SAC3/GANP/Nin1/mts3/eIF-3 p25 family-domain-containing protein n=1 Tax=Apiospora kogelbergensis TaxID=1337665 RepID=UPI0031308760